MLEFDWNGIREKLLVLRKWIVPIIKDYQNLIGLLGISLAIHLGFTVLNSRNLADQSINENITKTNVEFVDAANTSNEQLGGKIDDSGNNIVRAITGQGRTIFQSNNGNDPSNSNKNGNSVQTEANVESPGSNGNMDNLNESGAPLSRTVRIGEGITVAAVKNSDTVILQELSSQFERKTGHSVNWMIFEEYPLPLNVVADIATNGGHFDIITIAPGLPLNQRGSDWLVSLDDLGNDYDHDDIIESVKNGYSIEGALYAAPLNSGGLLTYYRTDLFESAGISEPKDQISYDEFKDIVAEVHDPANGIYGTCLRSKPGWDQNMFIVSQIINAFGGRWFDMQLNPTIVSIEWRNAIEYYADLMVKYGPPDATSYDFGKSHADFADGKCATWIDTAFAAYQILNPQVSSISDSTGFFKVPKQVNGNGSNLLQGMGLAIPKSSRNVDAAKKFIGWATSKEYIELVGESKGWNLIPQGTRVSTYHNSEYLEAAPYANAILKSIETAKPATAVQNPIAYSGVQIATIPDFKSIGSYVGRQISAVLDGRQSVDDALAKSQNFSVNEMAKSGYIR